MLSITIEKIIFECLAPRNFCWYYPLYLGVIVFVYPWALLIADVNSFLMERFTLLETLVFLDLHLHMQCHWTSLEIFMHVAYWIWLLANIMMGKFVEQITKFVEQI